jgi:hypothetical protein
MVTTIGWTPQQPVVRSTPSHPTSVKSKARRRRGDTSGLAVGCHTGLVEPAHILATAE